MSLGTYFKYIILVIMVWGCKEKTHHKAPEAPADTLVLEQESPEWLYQDLEGTPVQLSEFTGKKVILNYWATWCRPCIAEMPSLERLQDTLPDDEYVILLASDQSMEIIRKFRETKGYRLQFVKYNGSWAAEGITALPTTFIINGLGERVERIEGETVWDAPEMIQKLNALP